MIFLRHPRPDIDPQICYGQLDVDIAEEGHAQIERALELTPSIEKIIASPAKRCRKLALELAARDGVEIIYDERLWEMNMGVWEGLAWAEIDREVSEIWTDDPVNRAVPGGESFRDLQQRVLSALEEIESGTAIVSHAGPIRAVQMAWLGRTFHQVFDDVPPFAEPLHIPRLGLRD